MQPAPDRRPELIDLHPPHSDFRADVIRGLDSRPRTLSAMYFYDQAGSRLFDRICELEEYYPTTNRDTRSSRSRCRRSRDALGPRVMLVEFGSGSSQKIRLLLDHLPDPAAYCPDRHFARPSRRCRAAGLPGLSGPRSAASLCGFHRARADPRSGEARPAAGGVFSRVDDRQFRTPARRAAPARIGPRGLWRGWRAAHRGGSEEGPARFFTPPTMIARESPRSST